MLLGDRFNRCCRRTVCPAHIEGTAAAEVAGAIAKFAIREDLLKLLFCKGYWVPFDLGSQQSAIATCC